MASTGQVLTQPYRISASSMARWVPVKLGTPSNQDKTVVVCTGATDNVIGVTINDATAAGQCVDVAYNGIVQLECASSVNAGDDVVLDGSDFTLIAAGTFASSGTAKTLIGTALQDGDAGDFIDVQLKLQKAYI